MGLKIINDYDYFSMEIFIADTYQEMSSLAAQDLLSLMQERERPVLSPASGDSPTGLYREIVRRFQAREVDVSKWKFVSLDEWAGMNGSDEGSCRYYLNQQLFYPLQLSQDQIFFFDGKAYNLEAECERIERFIKEQDGIDVAVVGVGMNGHVGLNEPGVNPSLRSHIMNLDAVTKQVGQKYFKEQKQLTKGITLGLGNLMEARYIFLLISGAHKADIAQKVLQGPISEQLPASLLRHHPGLRVYMDREAATGLEER
ncbi:glucosamine-6-phosphate deaminase [Chitinophagaceae bacterium LB-8]|uniref:Glucosamine-6-phosphate deaminase n=1 Tax=Paraflavisolibacter caeni TaxID=2982496 RepID=A0A9X2XUE7_9BACT|nr:glucosamine-6-phosphate deaminase [Paraflavisolibacter caeni]MCU7548682.1 glucosamine-6-phosphate deaminase [Paraflavisolibacter caeni]